MTELLIGGLAVGGMALAYGTYRLGAFVVGMKAYRDNAKLGALLAPPGFAITGASSERAKDLKWFVIDDQVMGGRSQSGLTMTPEGEIHFAGTINTRGGGFSSCRTLGDEAPLGIPANSQHIEVTAVGDGRLYKLNLLMGDSWSMSQPSWSHDFHTESTGKEQTFRLPLHDFVPSRRGQPVPGLVLDPSKVTGVGLALSLYNMRGEPNPHFGDGPFQVTLRGLAVSP